MLEVAVLFLLWTAQVSFVSSTQDDKIVGGYYVLKPTTLPFIVSIQFEYIGHNCGGSLFTTSYVVTACHCLAEVGEGANSRSTVMDLFNLRFVAGLTDVKNLRGTETRLATKLYVHPKCRRIITVVFDYGVARMKSPFSITESIRPFKLLDQDPWKMRNKFYDMIRNPRTVCTVAGWGDTRAGSSDQPKASRYLKAVRMYTISTDQCKIAYGRRNSKFRTFDFGSYDQICTVSRHYNESDCVGDSGSPFSCGEYVVAVVSYGYECGTATPSVYSLLTHFISWFDSDIERLSNILPQPTESLRAQGVGPRKSNSDSLLLMSEEKNALLYWLLCLSIVLHWMVRMA